jgi:hypothetical protein
LILTLCNFAKSKFHPSDISVRHHLGTRGANMKIARMILSALLVWSTIAWTSEATARRGRRDTVRNNCLIQAMRRFPAATTGVDMKRKRSASYKACMVAAGRRP